jgi:biotin synthase
VEVQDWISIVRAMDEDKAIDDVTAVAVLQADADDLPRLMDAATRVRARYFGKYVNLCSILNARSGACSENCSYCAQSSHHKTKVEIYALKDAGKIGAAYQSAGQTPIRRYGVVTSGDALSEAELDEVCRAIRANSAHPVLWCASLGGLTQQQLARLKAAGMRRYHHNLETAPSFFNTICTTHTFEDRLRTLRLARSVGLELCSGGLMGMGETLEQRVEFARILANEQVDSIPLNFLVPIPGTPLENQEPMSPLEILKMVIMVRLMVLKADVRVCGGRGHLRDLQSLLFFAGATSIMVGPLLTVPGREVKHDVQMITDLGLEIEQN